MTDSKADRSQSNQFVQGQLFDFDRDTSAENAATMSDRDRDSLLVNLLALASVKGIGFKTLCGLFDADFLKDMWQRDAQEFALQLSELLPGKNQSDLANTVYAKKPKWIEAGQDYAEQLHNQDISFIPQGHRDYPTSLLNLQKPPCWIFVQGDLEALHSSLIIAVIGSRKASVDGLRLAHRSAKELVTRNIVVLSGMAKGIDEQAHRGAVDCYGQSIAILGHGMTTPYTSLDMDLVSRLLDTDGAIVSEYLPTDPPSRPNFLRRNELQAAMSNVVIPIECPILESGTGATIRRAEKLTTPIVGLTPQDTKEKSLLATRDNLKQRGHPVFTVGKGAVEFWNYLQSKFPTHRWNFSPNSQQDRLFRIIGHRLLEAKGRLSLDDEAIDRFAQYLKNELKKRN